MIDRAKEAFARTYTDNKKPVYLSTAPGRVNIIGEHTDYNHGYVFPCGLDSHMYLVFRPRDDAVVNVYAIDLDEKGSANTALVDFKKDKESLPRFLHYIVGPVKFMQKQSSCPAPLRGFDAVLTSNIPNGGGVSSSSALCVAAACAYRSVNAEVLSGMSDHDFLMSVCEGEWAWSGVRGGIMDQYASIHSKEGCAFVLDCRKGAIHPDYHHIPLPANLTLLVANTNVKHDLVGTPYNDRRASCERAAAGIQATFPSRKVTHLRDADMKMLEESKDRIDPEDYQRALHVIREDVRTLACGDALKAGDLQRAGQLVNESHEDLSKVYEVSCPELDTMVKLVRTYPGTYGARMMGGGFGGCTICLVEPEKADAIIAQLTVDYKKATGRDPHIIATKPGSGAQVKSLGHVHKANL